MNFTGALTWNSSGDLINEYVPGQRRWSGKPTPYLDEAWDGLEECKRPSLSLPLHARHARHTYL